jgi:hypothetical protein
MPQLTQFLLNHNISEELLILLLFIAIVTTFSNIFRYLFGIKSLGLYPSIMLALAFYLTGAKYGIVLLIIMTLITFLTHEIFRKIRMHYLSRIALNYIAITIILTLILLVIDLTGIEALQQMVAKINPISVVIIASLSDFIIKLYVKKDLMTTFRAFVETIIIAIIGWSFIIISPIRDFLLNNIWVLILLIPINLFIGQVTVLRVTEYFRFKKLIDNAARPTDRK